MGYIIIPKGKYSNKDAVDNVLHYVTRTRVDDDGKDIYFTYACGTNYNDGIDRAIEQFKITENIYNIDARGGRRIFHEIFTLSPLEGSDAPYEVILEALKYVTINACEEYFRRGFQVVAAIHNKDSFAPRLHIHFAINAINFIDGYKWKTRRSDIKDREEVLNYYFHDYIQKNWKYKIISIKDLYC